MYDSRKNGWDRCEEHDAERRDTPASYREVSTLHKNRNLFVDEGAGSFAYHCACVRAFLFVPCVHVAGAFTMLKGGRRRSRVAGAAAEPTPPNPLLPPVSDNFLYDFINLYFSPQAMQIILCSVFEGRWLSHLHCPQCASIIKMMD